mmetsp:Transcript_17605/g.26684  ORF Transcript_17605/g.26684 Transcript_17605/m.26684 type:complete len:413 (-) Transcript_17605:409-1647(-)
MGFQGSPHSKLVQRKIGSAVNADREFSKISSDVSEIPIVLVPRNHRLPKFTLGVPSGPFVLYQKWNADKGLLKPGVRWLWWPWYRISHIATKRIISYNAPAKNCPTADNIMVNVDLSLTFQIGPDEVDAVNFVYSLGATRLDELLSAEAEEAIRALVYSVTHDKVNDLREEFAHGMLKTLKRKIKPYGVDILHVKITDVALPTDLQNRLESTTAYKTKLGEEEKTYENKVRILEDEATKELETVKRSNARKIQVIKAEQARFDLLKKAVENQTRGGSTIMQIEASTKSEMATKQAIGNEIIEIEKAHHKVEQILNQAKLESLRMKIEAKQQAAVMIIESEALIDVAESQAACMIADAEAEADGAEKLIEKRRFEVEWSRLDVLKKIAGKGRRFVTGEVGEAVLNDLIPETKF